MRDGIDPRHDLEPSRKAVDGNERVGEEGQRNMIIMDIPWTAPALLALCRSKEDPGDGPAGDDGKHHSGEHAGNTTTGAVAHDYATVRVMPAAMA